MTLLFGFLGKSLDNYGKVEQYAELLQKDYLGPLAGFCFGHYYAQKSLKLEISLAANGNVVLFSINPFLDKTQRNLYLDFSAIDGLDR